MKLPVAGFVLASLLASEAVATPKTLWTQQRAKGLGRRALSAAMEDRAVKTKRQEEEDSCVVKSALDIEAPKSNVWVGLTDKEAASVLTWMFAQDDLNLTVSEDAGTWDNTVLLVELMRPNKTDALAYVDGSSPAPARYAHAVINNQATMEPYIQDILVGPLPIDNTTATWSPLEYTLTRKTEGKVRNLEADGDLVYGPWHTRIRKSVSGILKDLWGDTEVAMWGIDPLYQDGDRIMRWDTFWGEPTGFADSQTLLPMGLFVMSDVTGRDPSKWTVEGWYYNGVFYDTTDAFRDAYWGGNVEKLQGNIDGPWTRTDQRGKPPKLDRMAPPIGVAPQGARFSVDAEAKYVEWMDWSFYIGFNRDAGMALYDIRFKGQRILYELGLQEALAHYAGSDPTQSHTAYLDTYYGFGPFAFELLKGYDCPSYATYLNSSFYVSETTHTHLNSICLFEFDADYPMMRHSSGEYVAATKNVHFTVRSVSTVGNYDYMFTYTFFIDGSLAVEVRASGYIQSAFFAGNEEYGFKIHDQLSGSMHDHVLNYKADFDIMGENNTVQLMDQVAATTTYPWSKGKVFNTMKLERKFLQSEDEGRFNWGANGQQQVLVVNQDERNRHGELRAYRVSPYTGSAHLAIRDSTILKNSARWAEHDIHVSVQKDTEPSSTHPYNNQDTANPPVNFDAFFDGESLNQTDLVLWLNLGMHHVPNTGDLPNTVFTTAHSGVQFMPVNMFDEGTNIATSNMVRVNYGEGETSAVKTFGHENDTCEWQYEPAFVDLWVYKGDVVVRKFPYDPEDISYDTDAIV